MSFNATAIQVFIASPSDVLKERDIIREILYDWNAINSETRNIVLLPIGWDTHATPTMGEPPQKIIDKTVLKKADLLVGVFWTRIGTPTDDHPSGTVEEIEEHYRSGKPTMLYFSDAPVSPSSVSSEQYDQLKVFKESCKPRGIYELYKSLGDFKDAFKRHLQIELNKNEYFKSAPENNDTSIETNKQPELSDEAKAILIEASKSPDGMVRRFRTMAGFRLVINQVKFGNYQTPKDEAIWESAIEQLENSKLIKDQGEERKTFNITRKGYELVDTLMKKQ